MKIYSLATLGSSHTLPIPMKGENRYTNFEKNIPGDPLAYYKTDDKELQEAIEASKFFKSGEIKLIQPIPAAEEVAETADEVQEVAEVAEVTETAEEVQEVAEETSKVYGVVTNFQQAKDVLFAEFGVSKNALTKPDLIVKKAAELGVLFPNLKPVEG